MNFKEATMAHPYHHALSSVKKWGGKAEDFLPLHSWFDESKMISADFRNRALRHHAEGVFIAERFFGPVLTISTGHIIPVRLIGERKRCVCLFGLGEIYGCTRLSCFTRCF
jgi:hypothetical protein